MSYEERRRNREGLGVSRGYTASSVRVGLAQGIDGEDTACGAREREGS